MQKPALRSEWLIGLAVATVAAAIDLFFGVQVLLRAMGAACVLTGLYYVVTRRLPASWRGQLPGSQGSGLVAVVSGIVIMAFGVLMVYLAPAASCALGWSERSC